MTTGPILSIEQALERLEQAATDADAWEVLFRQNWPYVFGWVRSYLGRSGALIDAEDIAQEVFLSLSRAVHGRTLRLPRTADELRTLLLVMARHRAVDHLRAAHRQHRDMRRETAELPAAAIPSAHDSALARIDDHEELEHWLAQQTPFDRQIMMLLLDGLAPGEIAQRLNASSKTIYRHQQALLGRKGKS